ncbi:hypothetical protein CR513_43783, partial [Mucuna pruriens]
MRKLSKKGYNMQIHHGYCTLIDKNERLIVEFVRHVRLEISIEIVYSNLCIIEIPIYGDNKNFITFIDDFSRKTWKSKACDAFKSFKAFVEKQSSCKIKTLRVDRGQEYLAYTIFFKQHGIQHQLITRYTHQQNGVVERKNKTIMNMLKCMCPTKSVCDKTLEEASSGRRPLIKHLRVFGCIMHANVKCIIFIGYNTNSKTSKLCNLETKKVIINQDVTFDEKGIWN